MSETLWTGDDNNGSLEVWADGLDTLVEKYHDDGAVRLTWVQAQQLYRWLKERLGE